MRAGIVAPLRSGGEVIGALAITSLSADVYTEAHAPVARLVADQVAPAVHNAVLRQHERRRRERLEVLEALPVVLGSTLNVSEVFARVADVTRPAVDFDVMGVALLSANGREVEVIAEVNPGDPAVAPTPPRIPIDGFSVPGRVLSGEAIVIHDASAELNPALSGDRLIIDAGARSVMSVPLRFGESIGGALYFSKRQRNWFDASDVELGSAIAAQVVLAIQHQRLGEQHRRLAHAEGRAKHLEERIESLRDELGERYGFERIVGRAPTLREALERAAKVAPTDTRSQLYTRLKRFGLES